MNKTEAVKITSNFGVQNLDAVMEKGRTLIATDGFSFGLFFFFLGQDTKTNPSSIRMCWSIHQQKAALFLLQVRNNSKSNRNSQNREKSYHLAAVHILTHKCVLWTTSGKVNSCKNDGRKKGSLQVRDNRKD